ncbi:13176_t:CDS:2, partial [Gigaspora rosea]
NLSQIRILQESTDTSPNSALPEKPILILSIQKPYFQKKEIHSYLECSTLYFVEAIPKCQAPDLRPDEENQSSPNKESMPSTKADETRPMEKRS